MAWVIEEEPLSGSPLFKDEMKNRNRGSLEFERSL